MGVSKTIPPGVVPEGISVRFFVDGCVVSERRLRTTAQARSGASWICTTMTSLYLQARRLGVQAAIGWYDGTTGALLWAHHVYDPPQHNSAAAVLN